MSPNVVRVRRVSLLVCLALCACASAKSAPGGMNAEQATTSTVVTTPTTEATTTTVLAPPRRTVTEQAWIPFATTSEVTLTYPAALVEHVGFHEANHDGAQQLEPLPTGIAAITMESRERGTGSRTAADVVVDPAAEIRSPVSGRVIRSGTYVLYCDQVDDLVIINPDDHPGWQVKILHIQSALVAPGDRVVAGETVIAAGAHQLPFPSQVDDLRTFDPAWPHVHIEVVNPAIRDIPNKNSGADDC
jgi:murein DD-endopeptidase MepM/ murein hydrolase activator NlpD